MSFGELRPLSPIGDSLQIKGKKSQTRLKIECLMKSEHTKKQPKIKIHFAPEAHVNFHLAIRLSEVRHTFFELDFVPYL